MGLKHRGSSYNDLILEEVYQVVGKKIMESPNNGNQSNGKF